jgi:twitching motility protein PilT
MQTMDAALVALVRQGLISPAEAEKRSSNPDELLRLAGGSLDAGNSGQTRDRMVYGRR